MLLGLISDSLVFLPAVFDTRQSALTNIILRKIFWLLAGPVAVLLQLLDRVEEGQTEAFLRGRHIFIRLLKAGSTATAWLSSSNFLASVASLSRLLGEKVW